MRETISAAHFEDKSYSIDYHLALMIPSKWMQFIKFFIFPHIIEQISCI